MTKKEKLERLLESDGKEKWGPHVELIDMLLDELRTMVDREEKLQTIASAAWVEAWNDGNGFTALAPDERQTSAVRCWDKSRTLKRLQAMNCNAPRSVCVLKGKISG